MNRRASPPPASTHRSGPSHWPATVVLAALLAVMAARTMLNEPTFHRSPMAEAGAFAALPVPEQIRSPVAVLRVVHACVILALAAIWTALVAVRPMGRSLRHPVFAGGVMVLAIFMIASALAASDRREGLVTALEQISLVTAAWLAMQCARAAWQRRFVLVIVAVLAAVLGIRGMYQVYVEIPQQVEDFEQHRAARLAELGHAPDSPEAEMLEARVRQRTPKGFWSLANVYGSLMVLLTLTAAGLAADKWGQARHASPGAPAKVLRRGEIPLPVMAAAVSTILVAPAVIAWWLTDSIGAIGSGLVAAAAAVGISMCRGWADRHRRALVTAAVLGFLVLIAAVTAVGLIRGGLPMRTLLVRWEYWRGSASMLAERPLLGVGPGNFPDAYLPHRPLGAEEAVKNPHNVIVQAPTEYGLFAGTMYLALLAWVLLKLAAPARTKQEQEEVCPPAVTAWTLVGAVSLGALVWRLLAISYPSPLVAAYDNAVPIFGMVLGVFGAMWTGRPERTALSTRTRFAGVALACGLGGFALHNLSDFALFKPGAGMVFWVVAGAVAAGKRGGDLRSPRWPATAVAALLIAGTVAACFGVLRPVARVDQFVYEAATAYSTGRPDPAVRHLARAVDADSLDGAAAADLARLLLRKAQQAPTPAAQERALVEAVDYAAVACRRNPERVSFRQLHFRLSAMAAEPDLLRFAWADPPADLAEQCRQVAERLARRPDAPEVLNVAAQLAYAAEDYDQAATLLERAILVTGGGAPILHDRLGDVLYRLGEPERAREHWRRYRDHAARMHPDTSLRLAAELDQLARMDPHDPYRRLQNAELAYHLGLCDRARRELAAAQDAEAALWPTSVMRFSERRWAEVRLLEEKLRDE